MKVKAYFSRKQPFYLLSGKEMGDHESFDAYPVEVDEVTLRNVRAIRELIVRMEDIFLNSTAPEDCAVKESALFETQVRRIFKTVAQ
jgi:hypothetical protein